MFFLVPVKKTVLFIASCSDKQKLPYLLSWGSRDKITDFELRTAAHFVTLATIIVATDAKIAKMERVNCVSLHFCM